MKFELQSIAYKVSVDKILFRSLFLSAFSLQANDSMERRPHPPWRMRSCRSRSCLFGRSFNPGEDKRSAVNVVVVVIHREVGAYRPVAGAPSPPPPGDRGVDYPLDKYNLSGRADLWHLPRAAKPRMRPSASAASGRISPPDTPLPPLAESTTATILPKNKRGM